MKRIRIIASIKDLFDTIRPMPLKEKINHILTSYTDVIFVISVVFVLLMMVLASVIFPGPKEVLSGSVINIHISDEGVASISEIFAQTVEPEVNNKVAKIQKHFFEYENLPESDDDHESFEDLQNTNNLMNIMSQLGMLISAKDLDFFIADGYSIEILNNQEFCVDLSQFLTEDVFTQNKERLMYMEVGEESVNTPVAIDISGTAFAKEYISSKTVYIAFVGNTERPDNCRSLLEYILNWSAETKD